MTTKTKTTIPRKYLLENNIPAHGLLPNNGASIGCDYLRMVAAVLTYAAKPVSLAPEFNKRNMNKVAQFCCEKVQYTPRPYPKLDQQRDQIVCAFLFVVAFPRLGGGDGAAGRGLLNGPLPKGVGLALWRAHENLREVVAARLPMLAEAIRAFGPTVSAPVNLDAKALDMFLQIGQGIDALVDHWEGKQPACRRAG